MLLWSITTCYILYTSRSCLSRGSPANWLENPVTGKFLKAGRCVNGAFVSKRPLQRSRAVLKRMNLTFGCEKGTLCMACLLYHSYECNASSAFWREVIVLCVVAMVTCVTSGRIDLCSYMFAVLPGAVLSRFDIRQCYGVTHSAYASCLPSS